LILASAHTPFWVLNFAQCETQRQWLNGSLFIGVLRLGGSVEPFVLCCSEVH